MATFNPSIRSMAARAHLVALALLVPVLRLPAQVEHGGVALDALLPAVLEAIAPTPAFVPMDSTEMARYVGRYAGGIVSAVTVDDGVLTLHVRYLHYNMRAFRRM